MPQIPAGWEETTLGKLLDVKHGFAFKWDYISDKDNGNVLLTPWNFAIWGGWKDWKKFYNWEIPISYILKWWEIVITMTDLSKDWDTLGFPAIVPIDDKRIFLHNQRIWLVEFISDNLDLKYCFYKLKTNEYQKYIVNTASWSTVRHTSPDKIKSFIFYRPSLPEQQAIAAILSSFDDKIELLRAENQTLEQMGQELFKERFGKWKIGDDLPEGWRVGKLGEEFDVSIGRTPPRAESEWFSNKPIGKKWISIKDMVNSWIYIFNTSEFLTDEAIAKFNIPIIPNNTTILSFKMTVGKLAITTEDMLSNEAIAHFKLKSNSVLSSEFIYCYLSNLDFNSLWSTSSIVTAINSTIIKELSCIIPDQETLSKFDLVIKPLFNKIRANSEQIQTLSSTRDQLLPKLMSGEVRVEF